MGRVILHIGTLKTGTTSFQRWFSDNERAIFEATGVRWFTGEYRDSREIAAVCMDPSRQTPAMAFGFFPERGTPEWAAWSEAVRSSLHDQIHSSESPLFVSCEDLCLLRTPSELQRLSEIFEPVSTKIVLTLRARDEFLRSWKQHLEHDFYGKRKDPTSFAYVGDDSWLVDYDALRRAYEETFQSPITVIDYETTMSKDGSIIPALVATFTDVPVASLPDFATYRLNRSARPPRKPIKGLARPRHYVRYWKWKTAQAVRDRLRRFRRA